MIYRIEIKGNQKASWNDIIANKESGSPICDIARKIASLGHDINFPWEAYREGILCLSGDSLLKMSKLTIYKEESGYKKFTPFTAKIQKRKK